MRNDAAQNIDIHSVRAFLAIPLNSATIDRIESIQQQLRPELPEIRWTGRDNLHLTLHFFGGITEENLEKASKIVVSIGSLFKPFSARFTEIGAFPSADRARVIWLGLEENKIGMLHHALETKFKSAGFPIELRPFRPHITIGRSRRQAGHILSHKRPKVADRISVEELILYESRLQSTGAEHRPRYTVRLTAP